MVFLERIRKFRRRSGEGAGPARTVSGLFWILLAPSLMSAATAAVAEVKVMEKEYVYQASDIDSKVTSRTIALEQVKRLLLEELGSYLVAETDVKNFQLTKDKVSAMTAGIVRTEILSETWDGRTYRLKAKMSVDSQEAVQVLEGLRANSQKSREQEDTNRKVDEALAKIKQLQDELASGKRPENGQTEYSKAVDELRSNEWVNNGAALMVVEDYAGALDAFNKAIALNPRNPWVYIDKGWALNSLGDFQQAIRALDKAEEIDPRNPWTYVNRGVSHNSLGDYRQAVLDEDRAVSLDPKIAWAYINLGWAYVGLGNFSRALGELARAEHLEPQNSFVYSTRAWAHNGMGNARQALADLEKSTALAPNSSWMHWNAAVYYALHGQRDKALAALEQAIRINGGMRQRARTEKNLQSLWSDREFRKLVE